MQELYNKCGLKKKEDKFIFSSIREFAVFRFRVRRMQSSLALSWLLHIVLHIILHLCMRRTNAQIPSAKMRDAFINTPSLERYTQHGMTRETRRDDVPKMRARKHSLCKKCAHIEAAGKSVPSRRRRRSSVVLPSERSRRRTRHRQVHRQSSFLCSPDAEHEVCILYECCPTKCLCNMAAICDL